MKHIASLQKYLHIGLVLLAVTSFVALPHASFAVEQGGLGGKPAHPDATNPKTQSWFLLKTDAGRVIHDELLVVNNSAQKKLVKLYPADSVASSGGGFALKQEGESMTAVGAWAKLGTKEFSLNPGESKTVPFDIQVPATTTPGEYTGGLIVQENAPPVRNQEGMSISVRMGVRIYLTVNGEIHKSMALGDLSATMSGDEVLVTLPMHGTGNATVDLLDGEVTLVASEGTEVLARLPLGGFQVLQNAPFIFQGRFAKPTAPGRYPINARVSYLNERGETIQLMATSTSIAINTLSNATFVTATATPLMATMTAATSDMGDLKQLFRIVILLIGVIGLLIGGIIGVPLGKHWQKKLHLRDQALPAPVRSLTKTIKKPAARKKNT